MGCRGGEAVVLEMVYDERIAVRGEVDVEFEEQGADARWCRGRSGEGEEDVAASVGVVEEEFGGQGGTERF